MVQREESNAEFTCYVDGAWREAWHGGVGFIIFKNGELVAYKSAGRKGYSPQQMEAQALLEALNFAMERGFASYDFYSDCSSLVIACNQPGPPTSVDWTAFTETMDYWFKFKKVQGYVCAQIGRAENELADCLAKKGREEQWELLGFTFPICLP